MTCPVKKAYPKAPNPYVPGQYEIEYSSPIPPLIFTPLRTMKGNVMGSGRAAALILRDSLVANIHVP